MGIDDIEDTIGKLQKMSKKELPQSLVDEKIELYNESKSRLYSYLPISKEYIIAHIDELDLDILQSNPRIQWDLELINFFVKKYTNCKNEQDCLNISGSYAMYSAIEHLLNDDVLKDIEKLYAL